MQCCRSGRCQNAADAQSDQAAVKANDKPVIGVDACHERHGDAPQFHQFPEGIGCNGDVGDLPGQSSTVTDGNACIRFRQGWGIVDAVCCRNGWTMPTERVV